MNTANKLTVLRMILVPVFMLFMMFEGAWWQAAALIVFIVASITDAVDGHIARNYNQITTFGKFMDPLADKLLVCSAMICLVDLGRLESWIVIIIIAVASSGLRELKPNKKNKKEAAKG